MPNRVTVEFRQTVRQLLEDNAGNVAVWLAQVANGAADGKPDPGRALDLLVKLAEFAAPKLGRVEYQFDRGDWFLQPDPEVTAFVKSLPLEQLRELAHQRIDDDPIVIERSYAAAAGTA